MTDLVRADPDALEAYSQDAVSATDALAVTVSGYRSAWSAFEGGVFVPALGLPSAKADQVAITLREARALDVSVAGLASALRSLDHDGDGALGDADGIDAAYLELYAAEYAKEPTASAFVLRNRTDLVQRTGAELFTVEEREGETRVVTLDLEVLGPLEDISDADLQAVLAAYGLTGEGGAPVHLVVHGWTGQSSSAAESIASQYDAQGVEGATVVAVNWDGGEETGLLGKAGSFSDAEARSQPTGDVLARVFTGIAAGNPDANVAVTAHSLGNHVAIRALSQMTDPVDPATGETIPFGVDYTGIQPAIPDDAYAEDPEHYGALVNGRIQHLTLTIDEDDSALGFYELQKQLGHAGESYAYSEGGYLAGQDPPELPSQALGDEAADAPEIQDILARREELGLTTVVVDHDSDDGGGHLTIDPGGSDLVETIVDEQIDRVDHGGAQSDLTDARELVYGIGDRGSQDFGIRDITGDSVFESDAVQTYLDQAGTEVDLDELEAIANAELLDQMQAETDEYLEEWHGD